MPTGGREISRHSAEPQVYRMQNNNNNYKAEHIVHRAVAASMTAVTRVDVVTTATDGEQLSACLVETFVIINIIDMFIYNTE